MVHRADRGYKKLPRSGQEATDAPQESQVVIDENLPIESALPLRPHEQSEEIDTRVSIRARAVSSAMDVCLAGLAPPSVDPPSTKSSSTHSVLSTYAGLASGPHSGSKAGNALDFFQCLVGLEARLEEGSTQMFAKISV